MIIRDAKPDDAVLLTMIAHAAKRSWGYPESWIAAWSHMLTLRAEYLAQHPTFVACENESALGFAVIDLRGDLASLEHLWVRPERKRTGIGREAFARGAGVDILMIESDPHAEEFYRRMGAVRYDERSADIDGTKRTLPLLKKYLKSRRTGPGICYSLSGLNSAWCYTG